MSLRGPRTVRPQRAAVHVPHISLAWMGLLVAQTSVADKSYKYHPKCANGSYLAGIRAADHYHLDLDQLYSSPQVSFNTIPWTKQQLQEFSADTSMWKGPPGDFCWTHVHGGVHRVGKWEYIRLFKCNNDKIIAAMKTWPQPARPVRFTFVRDPLDRFVSGYRELEFRYRCARPAKDLTTVTNLSFVKLNHGSSARTRAFLLDFFLGESAIWTDYNPEAAYQHICPYAFASGFGSSHPVFVGQLERFDESLRQLGRRAGFNQGLRMPVSDEEEDHFSSNDAIANMDKFLMSTLLSTNPRMVMTLAKRYRIDACLFGYNVTACAPIPPQMQQTLAARQIAKVEKLVINLLPALETGP
eukprot:m.195087 g.195087  ORF g.195087 m.195087 type:complete len:356 (+) comp19381_c0_seq1:334-1401(+)